MLIVRIDIPKAVTKNILAVEALNIVQCIAVQLFKILIKILSLQYLNSPPKKCSTINFLFDFDICDTSTLKSQRYVSFFHH